VELIDGYIVDMTPIGPPHVVAVMLLAAALAQAFNAGYIIRQQAPLATDAFGEPQPDIAVVPGAVRDYGHTHPTSAVLIVEIADSSLRYDRLTKGSLYAAVGVPEYWVVNLTEHQVEVYQQPTADASSPHGSRYADCTVLTAEGQLCPLAGNGQTIAVRDILP
jgi:Uma2 family endonuclease